MTAKRVARAITPPIVVDGWRRLARRRQAASSSQPEWEYVPDGWDAAPDGTSGASGWDIEAVRDAYRQKLRAFRDGIDPTGPLAVATSPLWPTNARSVHDQNAVLAFAYVLALAARQSSAVSVLDWGGGVGLHSLLGRALLPSAVELDYHCRDLPLVCELGRDELPSVQFHDNDGCLDRTYDLVFASSSLQYSEEWTQVFGRLAAATGRYLYVAKVPVVVECPSFVVRQRAQEYGLDTEYLSWVLNRGELLDCAERAGLELVREVVYGYRPLVHGAPEQDETSGFLFRPSSSTD
jgi:putative methyltransferase (TIGR04325 family)